MVDIMGAIIRGLALLGIGFVLHASTPNVSLYPIHTTIGTPIEYTVHMPAPVSSNAWASIHQQLSTGIHVESLHIDQTTIQATLIPFSLGARVIPSVNTHSGIIPSQMIDVSAMTQQTTPKVSSTFLTTHQTPYPHTYWQLAAPLWLLAVIPLIMARRIQPHSLPKPLHYIVALPGLFRMLMPLAFRLGVGIVVVGLAHPVYVTDQPIHTQKPYHVMIVLDTSQAMQTIDFKPQHRLKTAQLLLEDWLDTSHYDRVGLIALGAHPYTVVPLTQDHSLVKKAIAERTHNDVGSPPNVGLALAMAIHRLKDVPGPKRIVLLSSGSQPDSPTAINPTTLAQLAQQYDIAIDTIGFGSPDGIYQIVDNPTYTQLYRRNASNTIVSTYRNDAELTAISHITQGHAFTLTKATDTHPLVQSLRTLTLPKSTLAYRTQKQSIQFICLGIGASIAILSLFIQWRRPWGHY